MTTEKKDNKMCVIGGLVILSIVMLVSLINSFKMLDLMYLGFIIYSIFRYLYIMRG